MSDASSGSSGHCWGTSKRWRGEVSSWELEMFLIMMRLIKRTSNDAIEHDNWCEIMCFLLTSFSDVDVICSCSKDLSESIIFNVSGQGSDTFNQHAGHRCKRRPLETKKASKANNQDLSWKSISTIWNRLQIPMFAGKMTFLFLVNSSPIFLGVHFRSVTSSFIMSAAQTKVSKQNNVFFQSCKCPSHPWYFDCACDI